MNTGDPRGSLVTRTRDDDVLATAAERDGVLVEIVELARALGPDGAPPLEALRESCSVGCLRSSKISPGPLLMRSMNTDIKAGPTAGAPRGSLRQPRAPCTRWCRSGVRS